MYKRQIVPLRCGTVALVGPRTMPEMVTAGEAYALLRKGAVLLDVRQPAEYRLDGHAPEPVVSVNVPSHSWEHGFYLPIDTFAEVALCELATEMGAATGMKDDLPPVIVACADGRLAASAAAQLRGAGLKQCAWCEDGLRGLEAEGMELAIDEDGEDGLSGAWV